VYLTEEPVDVFDLVQDPGREREVDRVGAEECEVGRVAFVPLDGDARNATIFTRPLQQLRSEVESGDMSATPRRGYGDDAGAAADIQHLLTSTHSRVAHQARGLRNGQRLAELDRADQAGCAARRRCDPRPPCWSRKEY
jgi:hypothetical protein